MPIIAIYLIAALSFTSVGGLVGYRWADKIGDLNLMQCEQAHLKAVNASQQKAREAIAHAYQAADQAILAAMSRADLAENKTKEVQHELKKYTTGRNCLSADARGLLQSAPAFERHRMPKGAPVSDRTDAAPAFDPGNRDGGDGGQASTDRDVAEWISAATLQYERCRARLDAIAEWDKKLDGRDRPSAAPH